MADSELAQKLARRQQLLGESTENASSGDLNRSESRSNSSVSSQENANEDRDSPISGSASDELKGRLTRRQDILDGKEVEQAQKVYPGLFAEFSQFSRKELKQYEQMFKKYDINKDGFICIDELKMMMEKLGAPQTHLTLKEMIREVDDDKDGKINLREFLSIFRKAACGELQENSALSVFANLANVDVTQIGVTGAKQFFEAKIDQLTRANQFEEEIKAEREGLKRLSDEKKQRHEEFLSKRCVFQQT